MPYCLHNEDNNFHKKLALWRGFSAAESSLAMRRPPTRSLRSYTRTWWPAWKRRNRLERSQCLETLDHTLFNWSAAAIPAGPLPMIATFLPVRTAGGRGTTHPSSHALSIMAASMVLMPTGAELMPRTHDSWHGAGQTRPVTSGRLFVAASLW